MSEWVPVSALVLVVVFFADILHPNSKCDKW
jgi:hypothetical protein